MSGRFDGRVCVLAGAATGIGRATARRLVDEGAQLVVGDMNIDNGHALIDELGCGSFVQVDVAEEADVANLIRVAMDTHGRVDLMFNNAGIAGAIGPLVEMKVDHFDETFAVMTRGVFLGTKHAARVMRTQELGGVIINTASIGGLVAGVPPTPYSAAKAAVISLTRNWAAELAPYRIRVNAVCPGAIFTSLMHGGREAETEAAIRAIQPWPERGLPEHVASAVAYLGSDDAAFVTGEAHVVDGGYLATGLLSVLPLPTVARSVSYSGITRGSTGQPPDVRRLEHQ